MYILYNGHRSIICSKPDRVIVVTAHDFASNDDKLMHEEMSSINTDSDEVAGHKPLRVLPLPRCRFMSVITSVSMQLKERERGRDKHTHNSTKIACSKSMLDPAVKHKASTVK